MNPARIAFTQRLASLLRLADLVEEEGIEGAIVECGTCNGGSAGVLVNRTAQSGRPVWLFDSFEGLPVPTEADGEEAPPCTGLYAESVERVRDNLSPGGFVVLDDYGLCPGCRRATDDFLAQRGNGAPLVRVDCTEVWFRKPRAVGPERDEPH